ncbi:HepT-like ribonuclease domain-containing protein [Gordonia polyisoprenivorans]|uniref:HepT-like ribonuclease domain-containing protein n=1 Tax=Gordonia polyisoprenivorans TaxID=84595 RepID=UPI001AD70412|nr:HepT-like ribonuclease domain-containing protein [Gordonia polyisoprenivorans]QTI70271.1 DUF86 domain-containing protein [Gordonia polyisoprenivorans]
MPEESRVSISERYGERVLDRLDDLIDHCREAEELVADGKPALLESWRQQRAAEAVIGRIGDTASHLPARFRNEFDGQPWTLIVGIRIQVAHKYHDLDYHQVWTALVGARALRLYVEDDILGR